MQKFALSLWPDSQAFVGNPACILVAPTEKQMDALDSAYLVPEDITGPLSEDEAYVKVSFPDSQEWDDLDTGDEMAVLHDYESQDVYVLERHLKSQNQIPLS